MKLQLFSPSTRWFYREGRKLKDHSFFDFLHGYIYSRWPYFYIGVGTGEHRLAKWIGPVAGWVIEKVAKSKDSTGSASQNFADTYHGKVVPLEAARQLINIKQEVRLTNLEPIIPYKKARDIIMLNPEHITVLDCPCRVARPNPCLPLDVCVIVGEPFASFILEHHPQRSRKITSDEAAEILQAEEERGHVHHAFFKDGMLGRFYAICNCCSCCCGAMQAQRTGTPMLTSSGFVSKVDEDQCLACGDCEDICPFEAVTVNGYASVDEVKCMGCGICVSHCTHAAMRLERDERKGEPLELVRLLEEAMLG